VSDITVLNVQPKDIEITLAIPLTSLEKIVKCVNNCQVDLPPTDEAYKYFAEEFFPAIEEIVKGIGGTE